MISEKILVIGKTGQLAQALHGLLGSKAQYLDRSECDFLSPTSALEVIAAIHPEIIINAVAYTAVDKTETSPTDAAEANTINHLAPSLIASWCARNKVKFIHYSTDYVYSGEGTEPWKETDPTKPLNTYGQSKLSGDLAVLRSGVTGVLIRTSWVYSHIGKNFFLTMLKLFKERESINIVNDQFGSPTYAPDLAVLTLKLIQTEVFKKNITTELVHACGSGFCSWHEFGQAIFSEGRIRGLSFKVKEIKAIPSSQYPTPAKRPTNSRLSQEKLKSLYGLEMPHWRESLKSAFDGLSKVTISTN